MPGRAKTVAVMRTWQLGVSIGSSRGHFAGDMPTHRRACYASKPPSVNSRHAFQTCYSREAWPRSHSLFSNRDRHPHEIECNRIGFEKRVGDDAADMHAQRFFEGRRKRSVNSADIFLFKAAERQLLNGKRRAWADGTALYAFRSRHGYSSIAQR